MQIPSNDILATYPAPNYINPVEHPPVTSVVNLILLPLCILIIGLRIFSRTRIAQSFGADDILIVLALLPTFPFCIISVLAELHFGWDRHVWDVPLKHIELGLRMILACECLFAASCTLTKLSVLVFIRRMLKNTNSKTRKVALAAMVVIAAQGTAFCFIVIFQCNPVSDYWKLVQHPQPNCLNQPANLLAAGIVNTITDLVVVLIPIPVVISLKLPLRQQMFCISLFSAGLIVCAAGAVRTWAMWNVSKTDDQTWAGYKVWLTGAIEMYLAILCASFPALNALSTRYFPRFLGAFSSFGRSINSQHRMNKSPRTPSIYQSRGTPSALADCEIPKSPSPKFLDESGARWDYEDASSTITYHPPTSASEDSVLYPPPMMKMQEIHPYLHAEHDRSSEGESFRTKSMISERSDSRLV